LPDTSTTVPYEPSGETEPPEAVPVLGLVRWPPKSRDFEIEPMPWHDFGDVDTSHLSPEREALWYRGPMKGMKLTLDTTRRLAGKLGMDVERVGPAYGAVFVVRERA
jgi:hypothetical protein